MEDEIPTCDQCGKKMVWTKAKNINYYYWKCLNECVWRSPVFKQKLTPKEKTFIKSLN